MFVCENLEYDISCHMIQSFMKQVQQSSKNQGFGRLYDTFWKKFPKMFNYMTTVVIFVLSHVEIHKQKKTHFNVLP